MLNRITIVIFAILGLFGNAFAGDVHWTGGSGSSWTDGGNWDTGYPPSVYDTALIQITPGPAIDLSTYTFCGWLSIDSVMDVTGGTLITYNDWIRVGDNPGSNAVLNISDGSLGTGTGNMYVGYNGTGTLNITGGTLTTGDSGTGGVFYVASNSAAAVGQVNLIGGTINCQDISIGYYGGTGIIDITGGTLIINGNKTATVNGYISSAKLLAFGGTGTVEVDYGVRNSGKTTVTGDCTLTAKYPVPSNIATDVMPNVQLSWIRGCGAVSHNVYFDTINPPAAFQGNQTETTFDPGQLALNTTYYWRVDEMDASNNITAGNVWTFTITSGKAIIPNPASGATNVPLEKVLTWTAGPDVASHDVYFGTDATVVGAAGSTAGDFNGDGTVDYKDIYFLANCWLTSPVGGSSTDANFSDYAKIAGTWKNQTSSSVFKGNFTSASYDPDPNLNMNTTYYWRVDEVNGTEIRRGNVWSFAAINNTTLIGKVMCGYQGWFNTPDDGAGLGWKHWTSKSTFTPDAVGGYCHIDLWPDMSEITDQRPATSFADANGAHNVFSSHDANTVMRHFKWMHDYGIDGIFLQRFGTEVSPGSAIFYHRNTVLDSCKAGANAYNRVYAVMYDLSNLKLGEISSKVMADWRYLVDTKHVGRDSADKGYLRHNGKPVVIVWGIGFYKDAAAKTLREYTPRECLDLVHFLKDDPLYGNNTVMVGVPSYWRLHNGSQDCINDPCVITIVQAADIVQPWSVGRYSSNGVLDYLNNVWIPDVAWCQANSTPSHPIEYQPVIFPGYSYYNASKHNAAHPLNEIPRNGGQFLWDQAAAAIRSAYVNMMYIAMFDEVDEGTAIFKVTNNPPAFSTAPFLRYRQESSGSGFGAALPSDEYLWLTGQVGKGLRGEITVNGVRPSR